MCVITQTVDRIARELRTHAARLDGAAQQIRTNMVHKSLASHEHTATRIVSLNAAAEILDSASALRAQAKLLDGKDK